MPSHYKGTPREQRALAAYINLMRASNTVHSKATKHLDEHGLTPSQFAVLEALYHIGPMNLGDLARKILRTGGNLTMVVDNLQKSGLVKRIPSAKDRRFVSVEITEKGRTLVGGIFPEHAAGIAELMSRLTAEEQERLRELCRKLGKEHESEEE